MRSGDRVPLLDFQVQPLRNTRHNLERIQIKSARASLYLRSGPIVKADEHGPCYPDFCLMTIHPAAGQRMVCPDLSDLLAVSNDQVTIIWMVNSETSLLSS